MQAETNLIYVVIATLVLILLCLPVIRRPSKSLHQIPTMGPTGYLPAIYNSLCFHFWAREMLDKAGRRFGKIGIYKMQFYNGWHVFVMNNEYIEDLKNAKDMSMFHAHNDLMALEYTIGASPEDHDDAHMRELIRTLNINFTNDGKDIYEESTQAIKDIFPVKHDDWHSIACFENVLRLAARVSNRVFVGEPLCHNPKYLDLLSQFNQSAPPNGVIINFFPNFLKHFIGPRVSCLKRYKKMAIDIFGDLLEERIKMFEQYGEHSELNPRDMITSFLEEKIDSHRPDSVTMAMRLLRVNFAGLALTSFFLPTILYRLATSPEYVEPLREHICSVVDRYGWTKEGIRRMYKLDSFIREVARLQGFDALALYRMVMKPEGFTFHDGITIPEGTHISAALHVRSHAADMYENPEIFDGMRFARSQEEADEVSPKQQITSPGPDNLYFGAGKHACPGRFLITFIIKMQVALILQSYDIKVKDNVLPKDILLGAIRMPNVKAALMYRKRCD